jgi:septum formation protein
MNFIEKLETKYNIVLASASPRRKKLLTSIGLNFTIIKPLIDEKSFYNDISPQNYCQYLSILKAVNVSNYVKKLNYEDIKKINSASDCIKKLEYIKPYIIISADTIVVINNEILNKPKDNNETIKFLRKLNNNKHTVFTGLTILDSSNGQINTRYSKTDVYFRKLNDSEIIEYVATGSSLDKAGGYGIQDDYGSLFVKKIVGCYNNVVGLPLELLYEMILIKIK